MKLRFSFEMPLVFLWVINEVEKIENYKKIYFSR